MSANRKSFDRNGGLPARTAWARRRDPFDTPQQYPGFLASAPPGARGDTRHYQSEREVGRGFHRANAPEAIEDVDGQTMPFRLDQRRESDGWPGLVWIRYDTTCD